jgi:serine/threonine protein kinase
MISTGDWLSIKALFAEVIELPQPQRDTFLRSISTEPDLLAEVLRLVALEERAAGFMTESVRPMAPPPAPQLRDLKCGDVVAGRYQIVRQIGRGGMCGGVYEGVDLAGETKLALKTTDDLREFFIARAIKHPCVCQMLDCGKDDAKGISFLTMELLRGRTLEQRLASLGPLRGAEFKDFAAQFCAALAAAHHAGVLHLDLKPSNVFLTDSGRVVLIDFGLARFMEQAGAPDRVPGQSVGTLLYMAPELFMWRPPTVQSDLFSLGVVLHEASTGEGPFEDIEHSGGGVLDECLKIDPDLRPRSAEAVGSAIARSV